MRDKIIKGSVAHQVNRHEDKALVLSRTSSHSDNSHYITNKQFQQRAEAVMAYATKTDEAIYDVFSYVTMDGELGDQSNLIDLSNACDFLEASIVILDMVREKIDLSPDDTLSEYKQAFAIANVEQATAQVYTIAQRIKEYPQDTLTREILKNLQEIKEEYQTSK